MANNYFTLPNSEMYENSPAVPRIYLVTYENIVEKFQIFYQLFVLRS